MPSRMRIMIVTDAWFPPTNGVVNTLAQTPESRVAGRPMAVLARKLEFFRPHAVHIATEGPLGFAARRYCLRHGWRFTTSYHTQFPQSLKSRWPIPLWLSYAALRRFHAAAQRCMVSTQSVENELRKRGFHNLVR